MTVFFATNRAPDAHAAGGFGAAIDSTVWYGRAGTAASNAGRWSDTDMIALTEPDNPIIYFQHGFDYAFQDVLDEAERIEGIMTAGGLDVHVACFAWPSQDEIVGWPLPEDAYFADQKMAAASSGSIADFLCQMQMVRGLIGPSVRMVALAHSMGNYALAGAMAPFQANGVRSGPLFDDCILAAADEGYGSFDDPERFGLLKTLISAPVTCLISRHDEALILSQSRAVNGVQRLGWNGPKTAVSGVSVEDFTDADPYSTDVDATHQYFLNNRKSLDLIAAAVKG